MARMLSGNLRVRVIASVEVGLSRRAAAERFGISVATAIRWLPAFRASGSIQARPKGGDLRSHRIKALGLTQFGGHPETFTRGAADAEILTTVFA